MNIKTKPGLLLVSKNEDKELSSLMVVTENEDDKNLFTCKVEQSENPMFVVWSIVVVGRYSLFKLNYAGETVYFVEEEDILGTIN